MMKVIGLTGGSGTGKTTVAEHLESRGAVRIDADEIAHELVEKDDEVARKIRLRFGEGILTEGRIDRKKLGAIVFTESRAREDLNAIVHPAVIEACLEKLEECRKTAVELVVIDAALLLEVPTPFEFDLVIALRAPRRERVRRLLAKGGVTRAEIDARLSSQGNLEKSFYKADAVVDTNKSLSAVLEEVENLVQSLLGHESEGEGDG
ncbi:MAG: dephospho-CoA kinase [Candidatus Latescibacterota bacterium]|nr:MAG: dephospho-CoA kinase [Candidatus Latescibacterota bacterium]